KGATVLGRYQGTRSDSRTITAQDAHELLLEQFRTTKPRPGNGRASNWLPGEVTQFIQVSQPTVDTGVSPPQVQLSVPSLTGSFDDPRTHVPANDEPVARESSVSQRYSEDAYSAQPTPVTLRLQGTFDPKQLSHITDLTDQMLTGYATAVTEGADEASREALGGAPLAPSSNVAGFVQPPPTMITTLDAVAETMIGWEGFNRHASISAIRVRVEGADIYDETARERIRLTAQRIQDQTGLEVDITTGASVTETTITLPAGMNGRPALELNQWWVQKGVATTILTAVDKKSVALFCLVLLVAALSVANAAVAAVRARRTELGVLACVGWRRSHLFRSVLYELGLVAAVAGALSVVLALLLGALVGTPVSLARALLAFPAALTVALAAGAVPALLAARADPMDAVRPVVNEPGRPRHARGITGLARLNLGLSKTRTALAAAGLVVAVATTTMLLAIMLGFQGAVVGTVLGDTVAVEARTADYVATGATLLLACIGVTNVMYLNIRDRGTELATLRAIGWSEGNLDRLITTEGSLLGLLGTVPGVLLGLVGATLFAGSLTAPMITGATIAWLLATALAGLSAYAATALVRRLPTTELLTE
ncbi:ABC transporter permease, partial [Nocardioides sp.]|uniref:ABC transporter permease n=1 Tax=Nocardioides sp. TaxID=35761 RepID=UPI002733498D